MGQPPRSVRPSDVGSDAAAAAPLLVDNVELFAGRRELIIHTEPTPTAYGSPLPTSSS